jgi:hypothetical protein
MSAASVSRFQRMRARSRGPFRRLVSLSADDWRLLLLVALMQLVAAAALKAMPLSRLRTRAARLGRFARAAAPGCDDGVVWAIEATGRRLGRLSSCLVRAIVAEVLLGSAERPVCVHIGVKRTPAGALAGHAWVTVADRVVIGASDDRYVPLVVWNGPSR